MAEPASGQSWDWVFVDVSMKNAGLEDIFQELESQTDFVFMYGEEVSKLTQTFSLTHNRSSLKTVLEDLADQVGMQLSLTDHTIIVKLNPRQKTLFRKTPAPIRVISGTVTDASTGKALIGATVRVKGRNIGTLTDENGNYRLKIPEEVEFLLFSYVRYVDVEESIKRRNRLDVSLSISYSELEEVLVIGYGEQARKKVNGAISKTSGEDLTQYSGSNFEQKILGRLSGIQINETNGQPGSDAQINIRGVGTLTAGSNPLIVVDGVPLAEGSALSSINPNDIESVDVLKDAASAAIYGSRAGNGVILITTKSGKAGKMKVTVDLYTGIQSRADKVELADAYSAAIFFTEARDWGYVSKDPQNRSIEDDNATRISKGANKRELRLEYLEPYLANQEGLTNTNWLDEVFRNATMSNINVAISGGSESSDYKVSTDYFEQEGLSIGTAFQRFGASIKFNSLLSEKVKFGISLNPSYSKQNYRNLGDWKGDPIAASMTYYPFFDAYNPDGTIALSQGQILNTPADGSLQENPLAYANFKNDRFRFRTFGNTNLSIYLTKNLKLKTLLGGDFRNFFFDFYKPSFLGEYRAIAPVPAKANETNGRNISYISENTLSYNQTFGDHEIDVLAGYTYQAEEGNSSTIIGTNILDDNLDNVAGASNFTVETFRYKWVQISYLGRIQYFLKNRYQLSAAVRRDGSSRFGEESKWGVFPSISAGWILSNEPFFPKSRQISYTKFRISWGETGNNQIGPYSSQALLTPSNYVFGNNLGAGFLTQTSPNDALSWETNRSLNIGADIGFGQKTNLGLNYYHSITSDLLLSVPVPQQSGYSSSLQNIGKVKNTGFELEFSANKIDIGPLSWSLNANLTTNRNKVLALAEGQEEIRWGVDGAWRTKIGGPIAEITAFNIIGIYKSQDEIDGSPHLQGTLTGDYIVQDVNDDGIIDDKDKIGLGTFAPELTFGFGSTFKLYNFDLSFFINGVNGRLAYFYDEAVITGVGEGFGTPSKYYMENRYHPDNNPDGFLGQPNLGNFSAARRNTRVSSIYMQDADYIRLRFLQIGYTLPTSWSQKVAVSKLRFYLSANNLIIITDYRGYNPDSSEYRNDSDVLRAGYAQDNYPVSRSVLAGLNLSF